jgi:tetratricopeptide (TPR) repeat protein
MDPARWHRIESIFSAALELPARERERFLEGECAGDEDLRREVAAMIASDGEGVGQIDALVQQAAAVLSAEEDADHSRSNIGRRIGSYQIVRLIGRGGMGAVYQAVRADDQYLQSVAIKLIAYGSDSPEALARFRTERQILATLQHPNIAAMLDGGATDDGQPYIVMEYIEGEPLVDYARSRRLGIPERVRLFRELCSAVQHAHQMLVIHRDIKPNNVLVTESGVPKLLDFGIAKLLMTELIPGQQDTTATVNRRMTPQYASPEQVRGEPLTTATDVYSLGVLLYELLVFESPYRLTGRSQREIEQAICDTGPMRLTSAVKDDPKLRKQLAGDLETIVAMALRKEPQRRYASVQQFSDDLQKHLAGFPVSAREDTLFYVAGKLMRRNRLATAAFAGLALSIAAGWVMTARQQQRTEERYTQVRKLANSLLFDLHRDIKALPGSTSVRQRLVSIGLEYLNSLSKDTGGDISLQWELAQAYELVGDAQGDPFGANLGQFKQSLASYRQARALMERVAPHRRDYTVTNRQAWVYLKSGNLEARVENTDVAMTSFLLALAKAKEAQSIDKRGGVVLCQVYQRLAFAYATLAKLNPAKESARLAVATADRTSTEVPGEDTRMDVVHTRTMLGDILWPAGELKEAMQAYEDAVKILEQETGAPITPRRMEDLQLSYRRAGDLLGNPSFFHFGEAGRAETYHRKALALAERLAARDVKNARAQALLYDELRRLAAVMRDSKPAEAAALYERSVSGSETLSNEAPRDLGYLRALANSRLGYSQALARLHRYKAAIAEQRLALSLHREFLKRDPNQQVVQQDMLDDLLALGETEMADGDYEAAAQDLGQAIGIAQELSRQAKAGLYEERCLAQAEAALGSLNSARAKRAKGNEAERFKSEAAKHLANALAVWARWRSNNLGEPYSTHEEQRVLAARRGIE